MTFKLDGVGPVDNRPFINKLNYFVREEEDIILIIIINTCDM